MERKLSEMEEELKVSINSFTLNDIYLLLQHVILVALLLFSVVFWKLRQAVFFSFECNFDL